MKIEEIASRLATIKKSLQATDLHSLTLRFEEVEKLIEEYRSQPTESKELPGDDKVNNQSKVSCKGNSHAMRYHHMLEQFRDGAKWMRSIASPLLASKDARIRELEEALRSIEIGADPRSEYQAYSWIDTAREIANKALTPPKP